MEPIPLPMSRNDLYRYMQSSIPLERILIKGRFLESEWHDANGCINDHMHWYRKVLKDYDPNTKTVLLSKKGSRRLIKNLDVPEKEFTRDELYQEALNESWMVRETDYPLY